MKDKSLTINKDYKPTQGEQDLFFSFFMDKENPSTYMNIYQSAISSKLPESAIDFIANSDWFIRGYPAKKRETQNNLADEVLEEVLTTNATTVNKFGDTIIDANLLGKKLDAAKFVKERLDKDNYSPRVEKHETKTINIFQTLREIKQLNSNQPIIDVTPSDNPNKND